MIRVFIASLLLFVPAFSATSEGLEVAGFSYELVTSSHASDEPLPMIVALHYMGGSPQTSREDYANISKPVRILLLAGPYEIEGGYSWFPDGYYDMAPAAQARVTFEIANNLATFLKDVTERYNTVGRPIIVGYSQGADLAHVIALRHGNQVGAILPMGARFETEWIAGIERGSGFPHEVVLFHGASDTTVPIAYSHSAEAFYKRMNVSVSLEAFANTAHAYPPAMKRRYEQIVDRILP